ncbi:hypothetical protein U5922_001900 [Aquicoccus sp. G2-2]|uniref:hypothetical protein n=1 Tax=Aquicoccus sp. G2-2 TaxID=3092120 RepID=UPI002AE036AB|nr:hypothetical protein [Aquicoccus sp. G2-2]MEA1112281.1 hypothetical protein [Aquicoccus sp. G2-2]
MGYRGFSAKIGRVSVAILAAALSVGWMGVPGHANTQAVASTPAAVTIPATISGFRSARFGMDEKAVRAAISKDFGKSDADISTSVNTVERTKLLSISVPDLLEDGGTAQVSYIFGYKSKTLIQIGASWSKATDPDITDATLVANGDVLSSHFAAEGFPPESVKAGVVVANGILLFRGVDNDGHAAILLLQGKFEDGENGQKTLRPAGLALLYSVDPDKPDIFRIKNGNF